MLQFVSYDVTYLLQLATVGLGLEDWSEDYWSLQMSNCSRDLPNASAAHRNKVCEQNEFKEKVKLICLIRASKNVSYYLELHR